MSEITQKDSEIKILPDFNLDELPRDLSEKLSRMSLQARFMEYDAMQQFMQDILEPETDADLRMEFENEGYDINYQNQSEGFYGLGDRPIVILDTLNALDEKGLDTRRAREVFKEIAKSVWQSAPKYYETRPENEKKGKPEGYNPNLPYPETFGYKQDE